jgi:hypothetical protein
MIVLFLRPARPKKKKKKTNGTQFHIVHETDTVDTLLSFLAESPLAAPRRKGVNFKKWYKGQSKFLVVARHKSS